MVESVVRILQRYVFVELATVFVAAFLAALVLTAGGTLRTLEREQVGFALLVRVMPLIVARLLPYILPVAMLLATTMVYGRMAADNEIVAVRAAGLHLWHVVSPALLLGLLASGVSLYLGDWYIPRSRAGIRSLLTTHIAEVLDHQLTRTHVRLGRLSIVHHGKEGSTLYDIFVTQYGDDGRALVSISAEQASFAVDAERGLVVFRFLNGSSTTSPLEGQGQKTGSFKETELTFSLQQLGDGRRDIKDMITPELWVHQRRVVGKERLEAQAEALHRGALGVACFVVVFVGVPLGIRTRSGHLLSAFAWACVPVYLIYFPLLIAGKSLAEAGALTPALLLWLPNALLLVVGAVLMMVEFRR